ncbi:Copper-transporting ATPase PAA2, chloroplastic-like protein [Drosera capensis]
MVEKKERLIEESRNRVVFAWTLVALCCSSHASHVLHSMGIHVAHGGLWDLLHNSNVKGGLAVGSPLGPGRVSTDDVRVGDSLLVLPGEVIPVDGMVVAGRSVVDESMFTGESIPVFKQAGLLFSSGTVNWVEDAQGREAPIQRLADSIAGPFVYTVMRKKQSLNLRIPLTRGQLTEPGFGSLAEVDGDIDAVGSLKWISGSFEQMTSLSDLNAMKDALMYKSVAEISASCNSLTIYT